MKLLNKIYFQDFMAQLIRFGITGAMATLVHFSMVVLLVETEHLPPLTANIFGFISGFFVSFSGHRFWTFAATSRSVRASLPRFFLIAAFNFAGNQSLYYILLEKLHMNYTIALIIVLGLMAVITYCLSKWWAFR
jgi:putative flippase GtrA